MVVFALLQLHMVIQVTHSAPKRRMLAGECLGCILSSAIDATVCGVALMMMHISLMRARLSKTNTLVVYK